MGPFAETREQLGGFFLIDAKDLDEAIDIAARVPAGRWGTVEIRPLVEVDGLPPKFSFLVLSILHPPFRLSGREQDSPGKQSRLSVTKQTWLGDGTVRFMRIVTS